MVVLRGPGSPDVRRRAFIDGQMRDQCAGPDGGMQSVGLIFQYSHMGGIVDAGGGMLPEVCASVGAAGSAARPLRGKALGRHGLDGGTQHCLGEALVGSRLDFNAQAWLPLGRCAAGAYLTAVMSMYRGIAILRSHDDKQFSDANVLVAGPFATAPERISLTRLGFLPACSPRGPRSC